jgi:hypothetical protein
VAIDNGSISRFSHRFSSRALTSLFFLELCAGCAMLTATVNRSGLQGLGVDSLRNRHVKKGPVITLDLTVPSQTQILWDMLYSGGIDIIHASPPCGTASRARDKPMSSKFHGPPALRSDRFPEGLPDLSGDDLLKVTSANEIYKFIANFFAAADAMGCLCSCENPLRSYMWQTSWWLPFSDWNKTVFQNCMHGGERPKWSLWISNWSTLTQLSVTCDNSHSHAAWGKVQTATGLVFATSLEAEYPKLLCTRYVDALLSELTALCVSMPPTCLSTNWEKFQPRNDLMAISSNKQPRRALPPLISEHKSILVTALPVPSPVPVGAVLIDSFLEVPEGYKLLRHSEQMGEDGSKSFSAAWAVPLVHLSFCLSLRRYSIPSCCKLVCRISFLGRSSMCLYLARLR